MDADIKAVHFIGIGGVGMSGIAHVAHDQGLLVTGSDLKESRYTKQLVQYGIPVHIGQAASNIPNDPKPDVVVVSTAIMDNNPELQEARRQGIVVWRRAQMLAALGKGKRTLCVAGTHGKTTSSSMLAFALDGLHSDPTFLIGGIVRSYGTNAHSGNGPYYAVEADESDKSFMYLDPYAVLITNIDTDHLDHYKDLGDIRHEFSKFISKTHDDGYAVVSGEDPHLVQIAKDTGKHVITFGFSDTCDTYITSWHPQGVGSTFTLRMPDGSSVEGSVKQNPGRHNVLNAAGVITLLQALGFDAQKAADVLTGFAGVRRRFDLVGEADGVTVVDDYAHHPTEITATVKAALSLNFRHVHVIFQPHRYSRANLFTHVMRHTFAHAFDGVASVVFMNVFSAGEVPVPGIDGTTFMDVLKDSNQCPKCRYVEHRRDVVPTMMEDLEPGDLVITMGAGDVTAVAPELMDALTEREQTRDRGRVDDTTAQKMWNDAPDVLQAGKNTDQRAEQEGKEGLINNQ